MGAPFPLSDPRLRLRLLPLLDSEQKIPRALDELGPLAGRRVLLLDATPRGREARQLRALGAAVRTVRGLDASHVPPGTFDALVCLWSGFDASVRPDRVDGASPSVSRPLAPALEALRPGGRVLVVQAYGRDDLSVLIGDPERDRQLTWWSDRRGPLLTDGWRIRTLHCWWAFRDLRTAARLLASAFPDRGAGFAGELRRPRLEWKVAVYHRTVGPDREGPAAPSPAPAS